jgi:hypothetical protein
MIELPSRYVDGILHQHKMQENDQLYLFDTHPFVPHAIVNVSKDLLFFYMISNKFIIFLIVK